MNITYSINKDSESEIYASTQYEIPFHLHFMDKYPGFYPSEVKYYKSSLNNETITFDLKSLIEKINELKLYPTDISCVYKYDHWYEEAGAKHMIYSLMESEYKIHIKIVKLEDYFSFNIFYHPDYINDDGINSLKKVINDCFVISIKNVERQNILNFLSISKDGNYELNNVHLNNFKFDDLDMHYGEGFDKYYQKLLYKIKNNSKGIIIFNGLPGSGKTYCIKNLIYELNECKVCILVSTNTLEQLSSFDLINFLIKQKLFNPNKKILLIIEDCDKLITSRNEYNNSNAIINLLNSSDGIINDILELQVLLTYNADDLNVDSALLRNGRLLSKRYFSNLSDTQIEKFKDKYPNLDYSKENMVVSDIYAQIQNIEIDDELENFEKTTKKFGFV